MGENEGRDGVTAPTRHGLLAHGATLFLTALLLVAGVLAGFWSARPPETEAGAIPSVTGRATNQKNGDSRPNDAQFTVEFSYRGATHVMPGHGEMGLEELLTRLGCPPAGGKAIAKVTSSAPSLVPVREAGDGWVVGSSEPFDTEETLLVAYDDGSTTEISVTDSNGFDLYSVNGSYITLLGNGEYVTSNGSSTTGSTSYSFDLGTSLTSLTTINVGTAGTTGSATVSFDGTVLSPNLVVNVADGWALTATVDGNRLKRINLGEGSSVTLSPATASSTLQLESIDGTVANGSSVTLGAGMCVSVSGDIQAGTLSMGQGSSVTGAPYDGTASPATGTRVMVGALSADGTTISAPSGGRVRLVMATSAMDLTNATVRAHEVGLGGGGSGTLSADGGTLDADAVGALDDDTQVGRGTFTANTNADTVQLWDYGIIYHNYSPSGSFEVFSPAASSGAPVSYRVRVVGANRRVVGHMDAGGTFSVGETVPIGAGYGATRQGWEFRSWSSSFVVVAAADRTNDGWMAYDAKAYDSATHAIVTDPSGTVGYGTAEITATSGTVDLYATYVPESLVMAFHTNLDGGDSVYAYLPLYVGAQPVDLGDYLDEQAYPALDVTGYAPRTLSTDAAGNNQVAVASFSATSSAASDLYVLWTPAIVSVTPQLLRTYEGQSVQCSVDGTTWSSLTGGTLEELNSSLVAAFGMHTVAMGETYPELPLLRFVPQAGVTEEYAFVGWRTATLGNGSVMAIEGGVTRLTPGTISAGELAGNVQVLYADVIHKPYSLTVTEQHDKWSFYYDSGEEIEFTSNGDGTKTAQVESDAIVRMVRSDETTVEAYWRLSDGSGDAIIPTEETTAHVAPSPWLEYSFAMPHSDVTGTFDATARMDTADGDYVFGTYTINGHSSYGYQVQDPATGTPLMTRRWIISGNKVTAYFTSSVATSNRIVVDAATDLHFDGVQLTARGNVVSQLDSFYTSGVWSGTSSSPTVSPKYRDYANLLALNDGSQSYSSSTSYAVNVYLEADSSVYCLGQTHWGNDTMAYVNQAHSVSCNVRTGGHRLSFYATIFKGTSTFDGGGTLEALTTGNSSTDSKVHWIHLNASDLALSGVTANASQRDIYCRLGGTLSSSGNGTSLHVTNSTLNGVGTLHGPHTYITNSTVTATQVLILAYAFHLSNSTVTAEILGHNASLHTGYANANNEIANASVVNVSKWISSGRLVISGGSKVTATGGLCLYQALTIYGSGTEVTVGSIQRFRTVSGSGGTNGHVYSGGDSRHQFKANIYDGAKVTVTGQDPDLRSGENAVNLGVVHEVVNPVISIYGTGTEVSVHGDADIINNLVVRDRARLSVDGNLTVHQDLTVSGSGTRLDVTGNLWHVSTATTYPPYRGTGAHSSVDPAYRTGTSPPTYWMMTLDAASSVTVAGSVLGSKGTNDRTDVVYARNNAGTVTPASVVRDIQVFYAVPDGFENASGNPTNIRVVNDQASGATSLVAPRKTDSSNPLTLGAGDWVDDDVSEGITGWDATRLSEASARPFATPIQVMHLTATPSSYLLCLSQDDGAVTGMEVSTDGGASWHGQSISEQMLIPVGAEVRVKVASGYEGMCFAESLSSGIYSPVAVTEDGTRTYRFTMSDIQIHANVRAEYELYLDLHDIHVKRVNGMHGFARYDGTKFVPYDGNILVTQKDPSAISDHTLYVQRDVDASQRRVSVTGIRTASTTACNTIEISGVTATLHLLGTNSFRNIVNPTGARLTLMSSADASTTFVNTSYYYSSTGSAAQYCTKIGTRTSLTGGQLTIVGGTYVANGGPGDQGAVSFVATASNLLVQDATITSVVPNYGRTFYAPSKAITIKGSSISVANSPVPYTCDTLLVDDSDSGHSALTREATSTNQFTMFGGVSSNVTLRGSTSATESGTPYALISEQTMTLQGDASYRTSASLVLGQIVVRDDAELVSAENASPSSTYGRIVAARSIEISGGEVICGQLLCAGHAEAVISGSELLSRHQNDTGLYRNGTIGISGGIVRVVGSRPYVITQNDTAGVVTPIPGTIGGVGTPTVSISGGSVSADLIGEGEYEFGTYYYTNYAIARKDGRGSATVSLTGGAISEFDTIGGGSSTVLIDDATLVMPGGSHIMGSSIEIGGDADIAMGSGAVIGNAGSDISIGDSAYVHGDGSSLGRIAAEGGSLAVGDVAALHVAGIDLTGGTIDITTTSTRVSSDYDYNGSIMFVPYGVGVLVDCGPGNDDSPPLGAVGGTDGDLVAKDVRIATRTHVGAKRIGSNARVQETGAVTMESGCHVYTYQYGKFGEGEIAMDIDPGAVINGSRQIAINYDVPADTVMPDDTVYSYVSDVTSNETIALPVPYRYGYHFEGWKLSDNLQGGYWTEVPYSRMADISLKAIWTPVRIWVRVDRGSDQSPRYQWQAISYGDESVTFAAVTKPNYFGNALVPDGTWTGTSLFPASVIIGDSYAVPPDLYATYLEANGVTSSGPSSVSPDDASQRAMLESLTDESQAGSASALVPVTMTTQWQVSIHDIMFDAADTAVSVLMFDGVPRTIDRIGTGQQTLTFFMGEPYSLSTLAPAYSGVPVPVRDGYDFLHWQDGEFLLRPDGTGSEDGGVTWSGEPLTDDGEHSALTARYAPKSYAVYLDASYGGISGTLSSYAGMDTETSGTYAGMPFFSATFDAAIMPTGLPEAQVPGYVPDGWVLHRVDDGAETPIGTVTGDTILSWDADCFVLRPVVHHTTVTYDLHGGQWTNEGMLPTYEAYVSDSLPTVTYTTDGGNTIETDFGRPTSGAGHVTYATYAGAGTKCDLTRRGYRFIGWVEDAAYAAWQASGQDAVSWFSDPSHTPMLLADANVTYADKTYHAVWQANHYDVTLRAWNTSGETATWANAPIGGTVSVRYDGATSTTVHEGDPITLPERGANRVLSHTKTGGGNPTTRQLLGWMFSSENPVTSYYDSDGNIKVDYATAVTEQMNVGGVFQNGETFSLPADDSVVPDPGDGGTLTLYAVYRERSLIFVDQRPTGDVIAKIADFDVTRSGYSQVPAVPMAPAGYELAGWYVNKATPEAARSYAYYGMEYAHVARTGVNGTVPDSMPLNPNSGLFAGIDNNVYVRHSDGTTGTYMQEWYVSEAEGVTGTYDVYVYSYYAPHIVMTLDGLSQAGITQSPVDALAVPEQLTVDQANDQTNISYTVDTSQLDPDITLVGSSSDVAGDDQIAVRLSITQGEGGSETGSVWLVDNGGITQSSTAYITSGKELHVEVYNNGGISETKPLGRLTVTIQFPKLPNAQLILHVDLSQEAATYELDMRSDIAGAWNVTGEAYESISGWGTTDGVREDGYDASQPVRYRTFTYGMSSEGVLPVLSLEGYTFTGWDDESSSPVVSLSQGGGYEYGSLGYKSVTAPYLAQAFTARWTRNVQRLSLDAGMTENWSVSFSDRTGASLTIIPVGETYSVPYGTTVTLAPKPGHEVNGYPEFVSGHPLDGTGPYGFSMPDDDVSLTFSRVRTLDVSDGDIVIGEGGYQQGDEVVTWHGDYILTGDDRAHGVSVATGNQPSDTIRHDITLQSLSAGDVSVDGSVGDLAISVEGTNTLTTIDCPSTVLTLTGDGESPSLTLVPVSSDGITGGDGVTIDGLACSVQVTNNDQLGGTSAASAVSASGALTLRNGARLDATTGSSGITYMGVVVDATSVMIDDATLTAQYDSSHPVSLTSRLIAGTTDVTLSGDAEVTSQLAVSTSGNLTLEDDASMSMIGNRANVSAGNIVVGDTAGISAVNAAVSGSQSISLDADVIDWRGRHLDVRNGDIEIHEGGYHQDGPLLTGRTVDEELSYVLVGGESTSCDVSLTDPYGTLYLDGVSVGDVSCQGEVGIVTSEDSSVGSISGVAADLTINGNGHGLSSSGDVSAHGLTLRNVTVSAPGHGVGGAGGLLDGKVGTVTLENASVTATSIGALGTLGDGFTLVTETGTNTYEGTLRRDLYRLSYDLGGGDFDNSANPSVLRAEVTYDGSHVASATTYPGMKDVNGNGILSVGIPQDPAAGSSSQFADWYILDGNGKPVALRNSGGIPAWEANLGGTAITTLSAGTTSSERVRTEPDDGTETLTVRLRLASGELTIRNLSEGVISNIGDVFEYSLSLPEGSYGYAKSLLAGTDLPPLDGDATGTLTVPAGGGSVTFTLLRGHQIVIRDIPLDTDIGMTADHGLYSTTLTNDTPAYVSGNDFDGNNVIASASNETLATTIRMSANGTLTFDNHSPDVAPTGLRFTYAPYLIILGYGIWVLALLGTVSICLMRTRSRAKAGDVT